MLDEIPSSIPFLLVIKDGRFELVISSNIMNEITSTRWVDNFSLLFLNDLE